MGHHRSAPTDRSPPTTAIARIQGLEARLAGWARPEHVTMLYVAESELRRDALVGEKPAHGGETGSSVGGPLQQVRRAGPASVLRNHEIIMPVGHSAHTTSALSGLREHAATPSNCGAGHSEKGGRPSCDLTSTGSRRGWNVSHTSGPLTATSMVPWTRAVAPGMATLDQSSDVTGERPRR